MAAGWLHHIDLTVSDLDRSQAFYARVLPLMGFERLPDCEEGPLWAGQGMEFGLQAAKRATRHDRYAPGLHHLAFGANSRDDVDRVHLELLQQQVEVLDAPALYEHYTPGYYAVFFADPDGLKLEFAYTPVWPA